MVSRSALVFIMWIPVLTSLDAAAETAPTVMTMLRGACSATLNGVDTDCDRKGILTTLPNGRTIFNLAGNLIATIGFAGKLQTTSADHKVLWVDRTYINQTRIDADGQCSVESVGKNVTISCKAILKDGRVLVAGITDGVSEISTIPAQPVTQPQVSDCETTMKTHAFLTRAQFQCGYRYYSPGMISNARACLPRFGESEAKDLMASGMATFDRNERERGHKALCAEILKKFPDIVRQ